MTRGAVVPQGDLLVDGGCGASGDLPVDGGRGAGVAQGDAR